MIAQKEKITSKLILNYGNMPEDIMQVDKTFFSDMLIFFNQLCPWMLCIRYQVGFYLALKCEILQRQKHMHLIYVQ